jgi:hypothetical protein
VKKRFTIRKKQLKKDVHFEMLGPLAR